jgi:ubiquinone/menaquinone biosynthesis C-methylase UbiE
MEDAEESKRLDIKTDPTVVEDHARWAGLRSGMRVADLGCGSGKTTRCLLKLVRPNGTAVGLDLSGDRIRFARSNYSATGIDFLQRDMRHNLDDLGRFDFVWIRFVLEYYRSDSFQIIRHVSRLLKPGGICCLIDLDHNCLNNFGLPERLSQAFQNIARRIEEHADFDPYAGRKLYSFLYDLNFTDIDVRVDAHHLIFGEASDTDTFNWYKKAEVASKRSGYDFSDYPQGAEGFVADFKSAFLDARRFIYTPVICCRGVKPPA